jgi:hypothetical protein
LFHWLLIEEWAAYEASSTRGEYIA